MKKFLIGTVVFALGGVALDILMDWIRWELNKPTEGIFIYSFKEGKGKMTYIPGV